MNLVIVGNSAAGVAAAEAARRASPRARITVIGDEGAQAYCRCLIPEILAGTADFSRIILRSGEDLRREGIEVAGGRAVEILPGPGRVMLEDGREIPYDRLLLATGAAPVLPDLPGRELQGVMGFRDYSDALEAVRIAGAGAGDAVVLGGGLVSLKAAHALKKRGFARVTLVVKSPHLMSKQLDPESAGLVGRAFEGMGVRIIFGADASAFLPGPGGGGVGSVLLEDGREIPAGLVIAGKGVRPRTGLAERAGGAAGRGILVDSCLRTTLPGVYAAGDCAQVAGPGGEEAPWGLWPLAVEQGRRAGLNMAGREEPWQPGGVAQNAVRFGPLSVISVGRRGGEEVAVRRRHPAPGSLRKFFFRDDRLLGYVFVNDIRDAGLYTWLVRSGRRVPGLGRFLAGERLPLEAMTWLSGRDHILREG